MSEAAELLHDSAVPAALHAEGLSAGFGDSPNIRDLTLSVQPGEVLALLGANGAGKSTTLMALAAHLKPAAGRVLMLGEERTESMEHRVRNGVAVVTQERCVFMRLTARARRGRMIMHDASSAMRSRLSEIESAYCEQQRGSRVIIGVNPRC